MGNRLTRFALAGLLSLALAAAAAAQTQPQPQLPPEVDETDAAATDQPAPPPLPPSPARIVEQAGARGRPRPWTYGLGVGAVYESNIDFQTATGPSGFAVSPRASVGRNFWSPRAQLRLDLDGRWRGYAQHSDLNRYYATGTASASYRSSPVTSWTATAYYGYGHTDAVRILAEQGVQLPLAKTQSFGASLGGSRNFGTTAALRAGVSVNRTAFERNSQVSAAPLYDGQSVRGTVGLDRRFGSRNTGGIEYAIERNLAPAGLAGANAGQYLTHFASLRWNRLLTPRSGLLIDAGASLTPDTGQSGLQQKAGFFGGASYSRKVKRSSVALQARREVTPAFGFGVSLLQDRFGLNVNLPLGSAWSLNASGVHVEPRGAAGAVFGRSNDGSLSLGRRVGRRLAATAESTYRSYGGTDLIARRNGYTLGLYLSLVNP